MAGERQLEAAAEAEAVDAAHDRNGQPLDAVEIAVDERDGLGHLLLGLGLVELAHVGADDEALLLAGDEHEAADRLVARALLGALDDRRQLLERPPAERVLALALAVEHRPGDALPDRSRTASPATR